MTHADPKKIRGSIRMRRSAGGGQPEKWEVTYGGKAHTVVGTEDDARAKLREMAHDAHDAHPER